VIRIEGLLVRAGDFALTVEDLTVSPGEYLIVLGPTASGKTLLLESVAGLRRLHAGRVWFGARDVTAEPPERRKAGLVYQDYALFPHLTVAGNIGFGLKKGGPTGARAAVVRGRAGNVRVRELASLLHIDHLLDRYPEGLSGGEQQRVALARALAIEPQLLLLDEPLSALDGPTRLELRRELKRLHRELGATVIHVTHDLDEAMALGQSMAVLMRGRLCQVGTPDDVTRHPADREIAALVGITNVFAVDEVHAAGEGLGVRVRLGGGQELIVDTPARAFPPGPLFAVVRAEEIDIAPAAAARDNVLSGIIRTVQLQSVHALVEVEVVPVGSADPPVFTVDVLRPQVDKLRLEPGLQVRLGFTRSAVHLCGAGAGRSPAP
jgi:molybdate transport system ATP-binding protein